jgi:hypothetical protein
MNTNENELSTSSIESTGESKNPSSSSEPSSPARYVDSLETWDNKKKQLTPLPTPPEKLTDPKDKDVAADALIQGKEDSDTQSDSVDTDAERPLFPDDRRRPVATCAPQNHWTRVAESRARDIYDRTCALQHTRILPFRPDWPYDPKKATPEEISIANIILSLKTPRINKERQLLSHQQPEQTKKGKMSMGNLISNQDTPPTSAPNTRAKKRKTSSPNHLYDEDESRPAKTGKMEHASSPQGSASSTEARLTAPQRSTTRTQKSVRKEKRRDTSPGKLERQRVQYDAANNKKSSHSEIFAHTIKAYLSERSSKQDDFAAHHDAILPPITGTDLQDRLADFELHLCEELKISQDIYRCQKARFFLGLELFTEYNYRRRQQDPDFKLWNVGASQAQLFGNMDANKSSKMYRAFEGQGWTEKTSGRGKDQEIPAKYLGYFSKEHRKQLMADVAKFEAKAASKIPDDKRLAQQLLG